MNKSALVALLTLTLSANAALAADPLVKGVQGALDTFSQGCQTELTTFCKNVTPGEGRILACLYAFQDKISPRCEHALYDSVGQLDRTISNLSFAVRECRDDLTTLCSAVRPGEGRLLDCLKKKESLVSSRCTSALKDAGYKK